MTLYVIESFFSALAASDRDILQKSHCWRKPLCNNMMFLIETCQIKNLSHLKHSSEIYQQPRHLLLNFFHQNKKVPQKKMYGIV
jgi:hypothetical protein